MNTTNFDWRWLGVILILLFVLFPSRETRIVLGFIGAAWMIQAGLEPWRGGRSSVLGSTKVTYWRGQRIETKVPARARLRSVSSLQTAASVVYLLLGVAIGLAALYSFAQLSGLVAFAL